MYGNKGNLVIAADTAGQWVPEEELMRNRKAKVNLSDLPRWMHDTCTWIENEHRAEEISRHRKWYKNMRFFEGRQLLKISDQTGNFRELQPGLSDPLYINNLYRYFTLATLKECVKSKGELIATSRNNGSFELEAAARGFRALAVYYQQRQLDVDARQREWLFRILYGNSFRYTYWDSNAGQKLKVPQMEMQDMMLGQAFVCPACGENDLIPPEAIQSQQDFSCPSCGNPRVDTIGGQPTQMPVQTGWQQVKSGDPVTDIADPTEIKLALYARSLNESPWLQRTRLMLSNVIDYFYPWVSYAISLAGSDMSLRLQDQLQRSAGNITAAGSYWGYSSEYKGGGYNRLVPFRETWIDPIIYATYVTQRKETFGNGQSLPPNSSVLEVFPDGMYIARVGGVIVDVRNESKNDHWTHCRYHIVPSRIYGDGADDAVEQQRQLNEADSLWFENIMNCSAPPLIINQMKIARASIGNKPSEIAVMKNPTIMDKPGDYIYQMIGRPLPAEVPAKIQSLKQDMQQSFGAFSITTGMTDTTDTKTASGTAIIAEQARAQNAVTYELHANMEVQHSMQNGKLIQKNGKPERYMSIIGEHSSYEVTCFFKCDLEDDIEMTTREHSWMPRSANEMRNDQLEGLQAGGFPGGIYSPAFPQEARAETAKRLNIPFDADAQVVGERNQRIEIGKMRAAFQSALEMMQSGQMPIPQAIDLPTVVDQTGGLSDEDNGAMLQGQLMPQQQQMMQQGQGQPGQEGMMMPSPEQMMGQMAAQQALAAVRVRANIDDHISHIQAIKKYLNTDKGLAEPIEFQTALEQHLTEHEMAMAQVQMKQMMLMSMGNPAMGMPGQGGQPPGQSSNGQTTKGEK